ncbi:MAG: heme o synthase [Rhodobacteraceae bacterium]|nr:heme o synthase [Paracoccaceae bacterium]
MSEVILTSKPHEVKIEEVIALLKPRVMSLVVFTSFVGLMAAPGTIHPIIALASILFIAMGAGASGALNMWWDADIDSLMKRTRSRPIPQGQVSASEACILGLWLSGFSILMLLITANILAALLLAFTIFFYAFVYTILLKRTTSQNIVIGGIAGALPPVIGWAVVTNSIAIEPVLLFLLIFLWTPPHFWALALITKEDYSRAGVPMLTVTKGDQFTRKSIFWYSVTLAPISMLIAFSSIGGPLIFVTAVVLNTKLIVDAISLLNRKGDYAKKDNFAVEKRFFRFSISYLFILFAVIALESAIYKVFGELINWPAVIS